MTYLVHITLDTADARRSYRGEVDDAAIAALRPIVDAALSVYGRRVPIPPPLGVYDLSIAAEGRSAMIATVWMRDTPVLTFGVARDARSGAALWRALHADMAGSAKTGAAYPPPAPWLGVRIEIGAIEAMADLPAMADCERCIAWAWLEHP